MFFDFFGGSLAGDLKATRFGEEDNNIVGGWVNLPII